MAATATKMRWGDALDEEDDALPSTVLPGATVTGPDARGIKIYTDYK